MNHKLFTLLIMLHTSHHLTPLEKSYTDDPSTQLNSDGTDSSSDEEEFDKEESYEDLYPLHVEAAQDNVSDVRNLIRAGYPINEQDKARFLGSK